MFKNFEILYTIFVDPISMSVLKFGGFGELVWNFLLPYTPVLLKNNKD